jgi:hypothetical protein
MIQNDMPDLQSALNEDSYEYVKDNWPLLAKALAKEVQRNASPDEIRRFAYRQTQRPALAKRLEQAAAHMIAERPGRGVAQ